MRRPTFWNYGFYMGLSKNKSLEVEFLAEDTWFEFYIALIRHQDHAGFNLRIAVLRLSFNLKLYDNRHWDYENNEYEE